MIIAIYIYIYNSCVEIPDRRVDDEGAVVVGDPPDQALVEDLSDQFRRYALHTCHILPPSEIDLGLCLAVFAGSGGKYLFHRIG